MGSQWRRGMTLTEILVVLVIVALLAATLLPALGRARAVARRTRLSADLNTISIGVEAYRSDFGDYPRPDPSDADRYGGAATLCRTIVGRVYMNGDQADGADGFVFRVARIQQVATGRVYGPYIRPENFRVSMVKGKAPADETYI